MLELETAIDPLVNGAPAAVPPTAQIMPLLFGKHMTYALSAVARLGVPDHMNHTPKPVEELAAKTGAHAPSLYRVLRMLAGAGVFVEAPGRRFSLTPVGDLLRTDSPESLRYLAIAYGDEWSARSFENFTYTLQTGNDGVTKAFGKPVFEYFGEHPEQGETFHRAMSNFSRVASTAVLESYDFSGIQRLADIGGGHGLLLSSILKRYPGMSGVLYDLPEVVSGAPAHEFLNGLEDRVQVKSGSFFEEIPAGCDAYIMKHIIHDWSDAHCRKILGLIREQLPADGRVLLCEMVVPEDPSPAPAKLLDIEMLAMTVGGKERTAVEFDDLFASAGLRLERIVHTASPVCLIEARIR